MNPNPSPDHTVKFPRRRSSWDVLPKPSQSQMVRAALDRILATDWFDADSLFALANRDLYANAALCASRIANAGPFLVRALHDTGQLYAAYRFAVIFGAVPARANLDRTYTVADLRAKATPEARLALIALGVERNWPTMDRRQRALFALRALVRAMQNRLT
jgi:hypothetical protein